jgi:hypothetical protein
MIADEPASASHALICSSIALALASMKIFTFVGLGILLASFARQIPLATVAKEGPVRWTERVAGFFFIFAHDVKPS